MRLTQTCRRQQEQLSQLRNIAWELMDTTYQNGDGEQDIIRQQEKVRGRIKKFRRRFAERLWLQPIVIAEWCPIRRGRHSASFERWKKVHCDKLSTLANYCFLLGALALFLALSVWVYSSLKYHQHEDVHSDDDDNFDHADYHDTTTQMFVAILLIPCCTVGLWLEFSKITRYGRQVHVEVAQPREVQDAAERLFELMDLDGNEEITFNELCGMLGFKPPAVPVWLNPEIPNQPQAQHKRCCGSKSRSRYGLVEVDSHS